MRITHSRRTAAAMAALALTGTLGLSACSGGSSTSATTDAAASAVPSGIENRGATGSQKDGVALSNFGATGNGAAPADLINAPSVIKTGSVALRSAHLDQVVTRVYTVVGGVGGDVSREQTSTDQHGALVQSLMTVRVPVDTFDSTLDQLSRLGTLVDRSRAARDVTTEVADVRSRVHSAERSIRSLRLLYHRAGRLGDVIRLESALSAREADLESLQAQQRALHDKTSMSTISLSVERTAAATPAPPKSHPAGGFLSGLKQGWHALGATTVTLGHALGVVLPLGVVVLLLAGLAVWLGRRTGVRLPSASRPHAET